MSPLSLSLSHLKHACSACTVCTYNSCDVWAKITQDSRWCPGESAQELQQLQLILILLVLFKQFQRILFTAGEGLFKNTYSKMQNHVFSCNYFILVSVVEQEFAQGKNTAWMDPVTLHLIFHTKSKSCESSTLPAAQPCHGIQSKVSLKSNKNAFLQTVY